MHVCAVRIGIGGDLIEENGIIKTINEEDKILDHKDISYTTEGRNNAVIAAATCNLHTITLLPVGGDKVITSVALVSLSSKEVVNSPTENMLID